MRAMRGPAALVLDRPARQKRGYMGCLIAADRAETHGIRRARGFGKGRGPVWHGSGYRFGKSPGPVWHGSGYRWKPGNRVFLYAALTIARWRPPMAGVLYSKAMNLDIAAP